MNDSTLYAAFGREHLIASGSLDQVLPPLKIWSEAHPDQVALVFEERTGRQVDFDLRGSIEEVLSRADTSTEKPRAGAGRPKLGVVAREVTLLPRHWEWLEQQPNGASAALRRLVEADRKANLSHVSVREAADAACRFMSAIAGNLAGYESATRALYARDQRLFEQLIAPWPDDVRTYTLRLAQGAFAPSEEQS